MNLTLTLPLDCADLLPHRPPMLLVGALTHAQPDSVTLITPVIPDGLFVDASGALHPGAIVELVAQGAAALKGYDARLRNAEVRIGYLVGIRDFQLPGEVRVGDELTVVATQEFAMDQVSLVRGEVRRGDRLIGVGTVKVWDERAWPTAPSLEQAPHVPPHPPLVPLSLDAAGLDPIGCGIASALQGLEPGTGENQVVGWFCFGDDFVGFRGHFPGYPILPAVVMPRLALVLAESRLARPLALRAVESAKINQAVFPGQPVRVEVTLTMSPQSSALKLKAKLTTPRGPVASFTLGVE